MPAFFFGENLALLPLQPVSDGVRYSVIKWPSRTLQQALDALGVEHDEQHLIPPNVDLNEFLSALPDRELARKLAVVLPEILHFTEGRTETREVVQVAAELASRWKTVTP